MSYIFFFGNSPELSAAELNCVLKQFGLSWRCPFASTNYTLIDLEKDLPENLAEKLGGTVKIATVLGGPLEPSEERVVAGIRDVLSDLAREKKIDFGLSLYGQSEKDLGVSLSQLDKKLKSYLQDKGFKARFVLPREGAVLTSVVVSSQKLVEICLVALGENKMALGKTIWVQDWQDWSKRDYGRPQASGHVGMLPPKLARMMVNLSLQQTTNHEPTTIFDPFCGVGTILAEGLMVSANVIGLDIDRTQVERTKKNLDWLVGEYQISNIYQVLQGDARKADTVLGGKNIDAVVTEPDLGPNTGSERSFGSSVMGKLEDLYVSSLDDWKKVLKNSGKVVIVLPSFAFENKAGGTGTLVDKVIDKAKIMGYSLHAGPFLYFRPQAFVKRNICVFVKDN